MDTANAPTALPAIINTHKQVIYSLMSKKISNTLKRTIRQLPISKGKRTVLILLVGLTVLLIGAFSSPNFSLDNGLFDNLGISTKTTPTVSANLADSEVLIGFTPGSAEKMILDLINDAEVSIRIAAYSFTSKPISEALIKAKKRGVKVFAILDKSNKNAKYSSATFLANNRIPTRINERYAIMHNKFIVVDDKHLKTGSFNYSKAAAQRNAENVFIVYNSPAIALPYAEEWTRLWHESEDYLPNH